MFFMHGLPASLRVLILEKGQMQSHADQLQDGAWDYDSFVQNSPENVQKRWIASTKFGGNSNCWWGQVPRFHPSDFTLYERHGRAAPWPIDYDTLEPLYGEVEAIMEVAGNSDASPMPRSSPFPFPPHQVTRADILALDYPQGQWVETAVARSNGGSRPTCCANGVCNLCPIDAKYSILNGLDYLSREATSYVLGAEVWQVEITNKQATGVVVRSQDGTETVLNAPLIALGTNAIYNPAIMLRSGVESPALGKYLHEQNSRYVKFDIDVPNYFGATSITNHCYAFYDGDHRSERGAVLVESFNSPNSLRVEKGKWTHRFSLKLLAEEEPLAQNTVTLGEDGSPLITWTGHSDYSIKALDEIENRIQEVVPFKLERKVEAVDADTEAHIQGTHRMGIDPETSVVDKTSKCHSVSNLLALGAGVFPTCSPANPTLTLSALALYAGRNI